MTPPEKPPNSADSATTAALGQKALALHGAGDLAGAEPLYRRILELEPENPDALHLLGYLTFQQGQAQTALGLIEQSLERRPENPDALNNLGLILLEMGRTAEAAEAFERGAALAPEKADLHINLGNAMTRLEKIDAAAAAFARAIDAAPHEDRGYFNLGSLCFEYGRLDMAQKALEKTLEITPDHDQALDRLGHTLIDLRQFEQAEATFGKLARQRPQDGRPLSDLGQALYRQRHFFDAIETQKKALKISPKLDVAWQRLGGIYTELCQYDEAQRCFAKVAETSGNFPDAASAALMGLNYHESDGAALYSAHRKWSEKIVADLEQAPAAFHHDIAKKPDGQNRLKIGYLSPDLHNHSVSRFLEPLLDKHDRKKYEIFCYADVVRPDEVSRRLHDLSDHWHSTVGLGDDAIAAKIAKDGIHILIDLAGHTATRGLRVFARRPAPVQLSWLGYPNTTGLKSVGYRLSDGIADPPGMNEAFYSEKLIRLDGCFLCYRDPTDSKTPPVAPPPVLKKGYVTFASFNNLAKLSPQTMRVWAALLRRVPKSKLLLKSEPLADKNVRDMIEKRFMEEGVEKDRLILSPWVEFTNHLELYNQVDIALDPFPYNGTTTTCEALCMGVPVITLEGQRHASRVGTSLLTHAGLKEFIARDEAEYVDIAAALAADLAALSGYRKTLKETFLGANDPQKFAQNMENALQNLWQEWRLK